MKTTILTNHLLGVFSLVTSVVYSQELRTFNQNASRSNHSSIVRMTDAGNWSFGVGTGASFGLKSDEKTLFRGNSIASKFFGRYYFGNIGLGLTTGIVPGAISDNALNKFITDRKFPRDQLQVTKTNPFNSYLLFGPSFRFGGKVYVNGDVQGGLFFNNTGSVNMAQQGAARPLYRFDNGDKNLFPGFSGSISINYPLSRSAHFFVNADYLQSKSSARILDQQNGIDVVTQINRDVRLLTAGIGIVKSFGGRRETSSGMATGRKHIGNVKYEDVKTREASSSVATGRIINTDDNSALTPDEQVQGEEATARTYRPGRPVYGNIMRQDNESCGPVTLTTTHPDGTTEQRTFSCPADAVQYNNRMSMNVTVPRQTQGKTFGEKVASGLQAAGNIVSQGVISGSVKWGNGNIPGIITNEMAAVSAVGTKGAGSGAASASYAATGRMMNNTGDQQTVNTKIYVREAGSGIATGKRRYEPVFNEETNNTCADCVATARLLAHEAAHVVQQSSGVVKNPLYEDKGLETNNPLSGKRSSGGLCGSTNHFLVMLNNADNGQQVAKTRTDSCGDFWFANVPAGNYMMHVQGEVMIQKQYEITINKEGKYDVAGEMLAGDARLMLELNTGIDDSDSQKSKVIVRGWNPEKKEAIVGSAIPGGSVISSAFVTGQPIGGIVVKGAKNSGEALRTIQTNEYGEFEFTGLEKGNYIITADINYPVDERIAVTVGTNSSENIVTSESNLKGEAIRKAQNNNTVRSNRTELKSILVEADLDGDGEYETDVTAKVKDEVLLDENGQDITPKTGGNTIRSRQSIQAISDGLYISYGKAMIGNKEVSIKNILKTKHETAKNSISNIR